jgi:hypothetical protein
MKNYNFDLAKKITNKFDELGVLKSASLGMHEDWFWTAESIFEDGNYLRDFPSNKEAEEINKQYREERESGVSLLDIQSKYNNILIGGIYGSNWATPVIEIELCDNSRTTYNCYTGEDSEGILSKIEKELSFKSGLGCLSGPVQDVRFNKNIEDFTE